MGEEISTFSYIEIEKNKLIRLLLLGDADIEKVLVSNKIYFSEKNYKYFIGYLYNGNKVKLLNIMLSYVESFDGQTKWMYFLIEDDYLLENYNPFSDKFIADI